MNIVISNKILIQDATPPLRRFIAQNYTIPNPEYITRVKLNKWLGGTPKKLKLYEQDGDNIIIPYGCLQAIYIFLLNTTNLADIGIRSILNTKKKADWNGNEIIPRDYQRVAVNSMYLAKYGILKAPCSSGKTIMGHLIAQKTGMKTLWLTHAKDLLNQSKAVGEMILGKTDGRVGTITEGKVNIGATITYATVQTMAKLDPSEYRHEFNCVIVDECHRIHTKQQATQMSYVVGNICAEYKYGLSATPETFDGYGKTVFCNIGEIKHTIPKDILEENGTVMPVDIYPIFTEWKYPKEALKANGVVDFNKAVEYLIQDEDRNDTIVELIGNKPTIILSNSIDHLCHISNRLSEEQKERACLIATKHDVDISIHCKHTSKAREEYIEKLRSGELDIMFSTYQLAKEGLNIPRLEQVILAFPTVDANIITQSVGRVARCCEGKTDARCYDLVDASGYFQKHWRERKRLYKKQGNTIYE